MQTAVPMCPCAVRVIYIAEYMTVYSCFRSSLQTSTKYSVSLFSFLSLIVKLYNSSMRLTVMVLLQVDGTALIT